MSRVSPLNDSYIVDLAEFALGEANRYTMSHSSKVYEEPGAIIERADTYYRFLLSKVNTDD